MSHWQYYNAICIMQVAATDRNVYVLLEGRRPKRMASLAAKAVQSQLLHSIDDLSLVWRRHVWPIPRMSLFT